MVQETVTILIVDDDADNLDLLERIFRDKFKVIRASHGDEALALLQNHKVQVIITDQRMPGMSGTQLLERSLAINPKIIKIVLSAFTDTADILSAVNVCRINHYLVKPISPKKVMEVVETALALLPDSVRFD